MALARGITMHYGFIVPQFHPTFSSKSCARVSVKLRNNNDPKFVLSKRRKIHEVGSLRPAELAAFTTSDDEDEMGEGFFEAIQELERMAREPSDILEEMNDRLSSRELQLVLVYFSQEGRDSWCALEVFEWLRKENRVGKETVELMVSLMCGWIKKLIEDEHDVQDVANLLQDMDCVGLKPSFNMVQKVISLYWEMGEKESALLFVKEILRRGIGYVEDDGDGKKGGPAGYLAWHMLVDGDHRAVVRLLINLRESGLKPEVYSYLIGMTAVVKELNEFSKALRKLKGFKVAEVDSDNLQLIEKYQSALINDGIRLSNWVFQEENILSLHGVVRERLLAMYICAGRGLEAEKQLWELQLIGKEVDRDLYDIVLAICASRGETSSIERLLTKMEISSLQRKKKTLSWLLRGYVKGGYFEAAADTVIKMLDLGLYPVYLDRAAVMQGLRNKIKQPGDVDNYLKLCKRLCDADLIGTCLVYIYIKSYKLWIIKMI